MIAKRKYLFMFVALIAGIFFIASCDEGYRINTQKMMREEQELLEEYLKEHGDSLKEVAIDTTNLPSGLIFFKMKEGTGDTVQVGKRVAYRYSLYRLLRDSLNVPTLYLAGSNEESVEPAEYVAGAVDPRRSVYGGMDEGIRRMRRGEKAKLIIPSPLWSSDFVTRVMDVEVTYVEP